MKISYFYFLIFQVTVTLAGLDGDAPVLCSRQVTLVPDKSLADALAEKPQYDAVSIEETWFGHSWAPKGHDDKENHSGGHESEAHFYLRS